MTFHYCFCYRRTENLILNHMSNIALRTGQLPEKMTSLVTGNPPLWITRDRRGIYVNQGPLRSNRHFGDVPIPVPIHVQMFNICSVLVLKLFQN